MNKANDEFFNRGEPYAAVFWGSPYTIQKTFGFEIVVYPNRLSQLNEVFMVPVMLSDLPHASYLYATTRLSAASMIAS